MKKIFPAIILAVLLMGVFTPILASAADKIPACCKLSRDVDLGGITYKADKYVGETDCLEGTITDKCVDKVVSGVVDANCATKNWGLLCMISSAKVVTGWIFDVLIILVGIMIIWGAFNIVTSAGSPEKTKSGRNFILYAATGLLVGLLAKAIPAVLESLMGRD